MSSCTQWSSTGTTVTAGKSVSLVDAVVPLTVTGVPAHHRVVVRAQTRDQDGTRFTSRQTFRSDAHGEVHLGRAPALSGSYLGVSAMGLLWSMRPDGRGSSDGYADRVDQNGQTVEVTVSVDGRSVASTSLTRRAAAPGVQSRELTVPEAGFDGIFFEPADGTRRPGVLLLGGSEGGLADTMEAKLLASHGYPTLSLAYFKAPGLPHRLDNIPLEYFAKALRWLGHQQKVDPNRMVVSGASRGSEAALLLGAHYPDLVDAVIARAPSNVVLCGYPDCNQPAWTLHGRRIPYSQQFGPTPADPAAVIPVENIDGPLLLVCGGADDVWPSCPMARAIMDRRQVHQDSHSTVLLSYPHASHYIGVLVPNIAYRIPGTDDAAWAADMKARARAWPRVLNFLRHVAQ